MTTERAPWVDVLFRFARLGVTSFGGPVAHLGYFRREFVERARWLDDATFGEIVALCSALPGPTSSQVGIVLGGVRAGALGSFLAWLAFTTPSAVALAIFGYVLRTSPAALTQSGPWRGALEGLGGAAVAVVLLAVWSLSKTLTATVRTRAIGLAAFVIALVVDRVAPQLQWLPLLVGALGGVALLREARRLPVADLPLRVPRAVALASAACFLLLLVALPALAQPGTYPWLFSIFDRAGSLVFGGGHVVLPFLQGSIPPDVVPEREFLAGYGAAQSVPGPLFTFSAFIGEVNRTPASGWLGALIAVLGIFLPSFLLIAAALPLWSALRARPWAPAALAGTNAAVVGLLGAVFLDPIALSLRGAPLSIGTAVLAMGAFVWLKWPPWLVVIVAGLLGALGSFVSPLR